MLTEDAKTRLEAVAVAIEAEPLRMNMEYWITTPGPDSGYVNEYPPCGIVGCIAGWVVALDAGLNRDHMNTDDAASNAAELLGIDWDATSRLFYVDHWPEQFRDPDSNPDAWILRGQPDSQTPEYAAIVAERIRFFIKTDGTDEVMSRTSGQETPADVSPQAE